MHSFANEVPAEPTTWWSISFFFLFSWCILRPHSIQAQAKAHSTLNSFSSVSLPIFCRFYSAHFTIPMFIRVLGIFLSFFIKILCWILIFGLQRSAIFMLENGDFYSLFTFLLILHVLFWQMIWECWWDCELYFRDGIYKWGDEILRNVYENYWMGLVINWVNILLYCFEAERIIIRQIDSIFRWWIFV